MQRVEKQWWLNNDLKRKVQDVISVTSLVTSSGTVLNVNEFKQSQTQPRRTNRRRNRKHTRWKLD